MKTYPNSSKFSKLTFKFWTDQRALPCCRHNYWAVIQSLLPFVSTEARPVSGRLTCQKTPRIFFLIWSTLENFSSIKNGITYLRL